MLQGVLFAYVTAKPPDMYRSEAEKYFYDHKKKGKMPFPSIDDPSDVTLSVIVPAYKEEDRR